MAGKGSKPRPTNMEKYCANFDLIVWSHKKNKNEESNNKQKQKKKKD